MKFCIGTRVPLLVQPTQRRSSNPDPIAMTAPFQRSPRSLDCRYGKGFPRGFVPLQSE